MEEHDFEVCVFWIHLHALHCRNISGSLLKPSQKDCSFLFSWFDLNLELQDSVFCWDTDRYRIECCGDQIDL